MIQISVTVYVESRSKSIVMSESVVVVCVVSKSEGVMCKTSESVSVCESFKECI